MEWLVGIGAGLALVIFGRIAVEVLAKNQGRVSVEGYGLADIFLTLFLIVLIGSMIFAGWNAPRDENPTLSWQNAVAQMFYFGMLVAAVVVSLRTRGLRMTQMVNLWGAPILRALAAASFLIVLALALVLFVQNLGASDKADEQMLIKAFRNMPGGFDRGVWIFSAVVFAPFTEEVLFRGYLYPVLKRYAGSSFGILLNSALFAAFHMHGPSLAPLFVLAVCFSLAFEFTGTLLVSIIMHSLFNSLMLIELFFHLSKTP
jgi:membrane protease YdiL (CAAX protease family)